ncbi:GNAT family N-acetyltransferase [Actinomycetospora sp. TBRC 11914]|uniref:GNAT family N-acetyltransferase n=1 Tax=Actinomycetospora sp. TBRC 11914 TaxID=2729387 RepID=UPI00145C5F8B|nr:GNAT family N-acetyltransferase [Actinomycetospora sp. TBRC 11914]NMO93321.1 GNAT family N-acetyltransferase [Actinomycetospora sp. TBRC 11914]
MGDVVLRDADRPGDLGWVLMAHGERYAAEYGWSVEAVTARIVADFAASAVPGRDAAWVADLDGRRVGSVLCVREEATTARLRLLLVEPDARGLGVGRALVERCVGFARGAGYARLVLWTNEPLAAARGIYLAAGFVLDGEETHTGFGRELLGQSYVLDLAGPEGAP